MIDAQPSDPVTLIAQAWQDSGKRAPTPVPAGAEVCMVPECGGGGWVKLKTFHGPITLCFPHFQSVRGLAV